MNALLNWLTGRPKLTDAARAEVKRDARGLPEGDPGNQRCIEEGIAWLMRAQANTASNDKGVARDFSLMKGWATSYPETTGYIVPTMIDHWRDSGREDVRASAVGMLDWLMDVQLPGGGFQGGRIDMTPVVPVTFNTGQILLGLAAGVAEFGDTYRPAMDEAACFLRDSLDPDGCWRSHPTPFAKPGDKAYETHVSWGLFEADRQAPGKGYGEAGMRQVRWALTNQAENGWYDNCCLSNPEQPLTHTLGYVLRGVIEGYRWSGDTSLLHAALLEAQGLMGAQRADGALPGELARDWSPRATWSCLTGNVQIAWCWLFLFEETGDTAFRDAAFAANRFVRRSMHVDGPDDTRGGVKGSFPVDGAYGRYEFLNWSIKFAIDAFKYEEKVRAGEAR